MNPAPFILGGSLIAAVLLANHEPPKPHILMPAHVNNVESNDEMQVSVEFSVRIQVINAPATKLELIRAVAGKNVMLEIPLYDDLNRSIGEKGVRARVVSP